MLAILWRPLAVEGGGFPTGSHARTWGGLGHDERWRARLDWMDREQAVPVYVQPPEPVPEPVREAVVPTPVVRRTGPPIRKLRRGPEPPLPVLAASRLFAAFDAMEQALDARADRLALAERAAERHRAAEAVAYAAWLRAQQAQRAAQQVADEVAQRLAAEQAAQDTLEFLMVWHLSVSDDL